MRYQITHIDHIVRKQRKGCIFLPARRYASAGLCESNVSLSVRLSVCHTPVLCQNVMISSPS